MQRRIALPLMVTGAILAVALLSLSGILQPIQNGMRWMLLPFARTFSAVGSAIGSHDQSAAQLESQLADSQAKLRSLSVDYVQLHALDEENASLRKLAGFLQTSGYDHVSAQVIARSTDAREASVLIDRGSNDGLQIGMAVVAEDGIYVGKITSLQKHVSTVILVSDERSRVAASVVGQKGLAGLVEGEGNGVAKLTLVPQSVPLKGNDVIVTAGTEAEVPANLVVGLINHVDGTPTDAFNSASLQPMIELSSLNLVAVLRPTALRPTTGNSPL